MKMNRHMRWIPMTMFAGALAVCGLALGLLLDPALHAARHSPGFGSGSEITQVIAAMWTLAAIAWVWLVLTTSLSVLRRVIPALRGCAKLDCATLPLVRSLLDRVAVVSLAAASAVPFAVLPAHGQGAAAITTQAAPYVRGTQQSVLAAAPPHVRGSGDTPSTTNLPTSTTAPPRSSATPKPAKDRRLPNPPAPPDTSPGPDLRAHVVTAGESLWSIARSELHNQGERTSTEQVARYWGELMRLNRSRLRSGNPNLIFVGETLLLPT